MIHYQTCCPDVHCYIPLESLQCSSRSHSRILNVNKLVLLFTSNSRLRIQSMSLCPAWFIVFLIWSVLLSHSLCLPLSLVLPLFWSQPHSNLLSVSLCCVCMSSSAMQPMSRTVSLFPLSVLENATEIGISQKMESPFKLHLCTHLGSQCLQ